MLTIKLLLKRSNGFGRNFNGIMCIPKNKIYNSKCLNTNFTVFERHTESQITSNSKSPDDISKELSRLRNHLIFITQNVYLPHDKGDLTAKIFHLIQCCGQNLFCHTLSQRNAIANELWNLLKSCSTIIDVCHYNALLDMYLHNEYKFSPVQFLKHMEEKGIMPNAVTYQKLIEYYSWQGDIDGAINILKLIKNKDHAISQNIFNLLIFGHAKSRDIAGALKIVDTIEKNKLTLSRDTYSALMCAHASENDIAKIEKIIAVCNKNGRPVRNLDILKTIYILAENNFMEHIDKISNYFVSDNVMNLHELQVLIKLIDIKKESLAITLFLKLYETPKNRGHIHMAEIFATALITREAKSQQIVDFCIDIENNRGQGILLPVVFSSFQREDIDLTLDLLKCCKKFQYIIRSHYFWPLLVKIAAKYDFHGMLNILDIMVKEFNVIPCFYTIKDFVMPHTFNDVNKTHVLLCNYNIPSDLINNAILYSLLKSGKTIKAAEYMNNFPGIYWSYYLNEELRRATFSRNDVHSFIKISKNLCKGIPTFTGTSERRIQSPIEEELLQFVYYSSHLRPFLAQIITSLDGTTCISPEIKDKLISYLNEFATEGVMSALHMFSANYERRNVSENEKVTQNLMSAVHEYVHQTEDNLRSLKKPLSSPGENELNDKTSNRTLTITAYDDTKVESIPEIPKRTSHKQTPQGPDNLETLKNAFSLIEENKLDDACNYLAENPASAKGKNTQLYIESMLSKENSLLRNINAEEVTKLFDALISTKYMQLTLSIASFWVDAYVHENNFERAIEIYCSTTDDKFIPFAVKHRLIKALIAAKDQNLLQKLVDHCVKIESKPIVLMDLFFGFLESGETEEATRVMKHDDFSTNLSMMNFHIKKYVDANDDLTLEKFLDITHGIEKINRVDVYDSLVQSYAFKNNWSRALKLWNRMQNENVSPNDNILEVLSDLLRKNNQHIPFEYRVKNMENDSVQ